MMQIHIFKGRLLTRMCFLLLLEVISLLLRLFGCRSLPFILEKAPEPITRSIEDVDLAVLIFLFMEAIWFIIVKKPI